MSAAIAVGAAAAAATANSGNNIEKRAETAYFTFGRFQPPTLGHGVLLSKIANDAASEGADAYAFVSSTKDNKTNPLPVGTKVRLMKSMFSALPIRIINTTECGCTNVNAVIYMLREAGYSKITMYVGEDRVESFRRFISADVEIREAAKRNARISTNLRGMSGTKMRNAAMANNLNTFKAGTGLDESTALAVMENIKAGLTAKASTKKRRRMSRRQSRRNK
jgi:hypothetical protein